MSAIVGRRLSQEELDEYRAEGWMKYGRILSDAEIDELRHHVDEMIAALPPGARPEGMDMTHLKDPKMFGVCRHPRVLDVIEQFLGPDIVLFASHLICKPGGDGKAAPWHQDSTYWPLEPMDVMTMWLAIDEATAENGCMRVVPRTHTLGEIEHVEQNKDSNLLHLGIDVSQFGDSPIVNCELKPGECTFHEARLVHGSSPNTSPRRRAGYTVRYMPASTKLRRESGFYEHHPIFLLRGEDKHANNVYAQYPR